MRLEEIYKKIYIYLQHILTPMSTKSKKPYNREVIAYRTDSDIILRFNSITQAMRFFRTSQQVIYRHCASGEPMGEGYQIGGWHVILKEKWGDYLKLRRENPPQLKR